MLTEFERLSLIKDLSTGQQMDLMEHSAVLVLLRILCMGMGHHPARTGCLGKTGPSRRQPP